MITYNPLKTEFTHKGFKFNQLYREGDFAIFHRIALQNSIHPHTQDMGFEVVVIKRHDGYVIGGVKLEPAETYPCSSQWGSYGWTYRDLYSAELRFSKLVKGEIKIDSVSVVEVETDEPEPVESVKVAGPGRGHPRGEHPVLVIPDGEFSTKELAESNKMDYPYTAVFIREQIAAGKIKMTRKERRNGSRKPTNLYSKI
jgi:hypothetical protein